MSASNNRNHNRTSIITARIAPRQCRSQMNGGPEQRSSKGSVELRVSSSAARKERFPDTDVATCCMIRLEAVQKTAMPFPLAIAVPGLLSKNAGDLSCSLISLSHINALKTRWRKCRRKRHCVLSPSVVDRHCRRICFRLRRPCVNRRVADA